MSTPNSEHSANWQDGLSMLQSMTYILDSQTLCDVYFTLPFGGGKKQIGAHVVVLASRSPVFQTMFSDRWNTPDNNVVDIGDIKFEIFNEFLKFLYTDQCDITPSTALGIQYAARKYMVTKVADKCSQLVNGALNKNMACTLYQKSCEFGEDDLKAKCRRFINKYADESLQCNAFLDLGPEALLEIISSDELMTENEENVYAACVRWARARCRESGKDGGDGEQCREVLGDVLYQIRLTRLKCDTLTATLGDTNILTDSEMGMVYHSVHTGKNSVNIPFNCSPRRGRDIFNVERFSASKGDISSTEHQPTTDSILVSADKDILLRGVVLSSDTSRELPAGTLSLRGQDPKCYPSVKFQPRSDGLLKYVIAIGPFRMVAEHKYELVVEWKKSGNKFKYKWRQEFETKMVTFKASREVARGNPLRKVVEFFEDHRYEHVPRVLKSSLAHARGVNFTFRNRSGVTSTTVEFGQFPELIFSIL